jgi:two-component system, sensor histidine kinase
MDFIRSSIRRRTLAVMLATTLIALTANGVALLVYEMGSLRDAYLADLRAQAEIIGRASAAALAFGDPKAAAQDLVILRARDDIRSAAIYDAKGALFARYARANAEAAPATPGAAGGRAEGDDFTLFHPVFEQAELVGTVYLRGHTGLRERLLGYLTILGAVMAGALGLAWLFSIWLRRSITDPIQDVALAARQVVERRDYSVRAKKTTQDEIGLLADAMNNMLQELEREIRERRDVQRALQLADLRKDQFLATLAHELRNPLAPIRNSLVLMELGQNDPRALADARAIMDRQVNQLVRLVDDLLDVSRISTGKLVLRRARVDLREVARNALEAVMPLAQARRQDLRARLPQAASPVNADATRLAQVLINLLNNAVKFTDPGGRIDFDISLEGPDLVAHVRDTGIGIDPGTIGRLFEIFSQADQSLERSTGGLGVGLWLSRRLVELHGGTLESRSEGRGKGAEFTVSIPGIAVQEAASGDERAAAQRHAAARRRVLVVDDNVDFATTFAALLRGLGAEVQVEHDGAAGLAAAERLRPDIAFLDIGMPKLNGYDLARHLRELQRTANCLLVAVTGYAQPADLERAREAGFDEHMVKPVDPGRVRSLLGV